MFLKNAWYAASWSQDLTSQPLARTLLNEPVVLFRSASGKPVALEDRCCHRAAPLSRGEVVGEAIQCGYHGLKFNLSGACIEIPGQAKIPPGAQVRAYPLCERWNLIWIWMGDPARADVSAIPELPWLDDPHWAITPGYIHLKANYQLLIDNLLDVTHASYLHRNTLAGDPREAIEPTKTERLTDGVRVGRWLLDVTPPPFFAAVGGFNGKVDRWQFVTWKSPATVYLDVGCAPVGTGAPEGDRSRGISVWSNHFLTPETDTSSHYLFSYARNFGVGDEAMSKRVFEGTRATFMEDVDMLEAQQRNVSAGHGPEWVDVNADIAQLQARRLLSGLLQAETAR